MTATADTAIWPASLADLERAAKRYVETEYLLAESPDYDIRSFAVLAPAGMAGPLIVPLPSQEDVRRKRLVHCRWLPALVHGLDATSPSSVIRHGRHPTGRPRRPSIPSVGRLSSSRPPASMREGS